MRPHEAHSSSLSQLSQSKTQSGVGPLRFPHGNGEGLAPSGCHSWRRVAAAACALAPSITLAPSTPLVLSTSLVAFSLRRCASSVSAAASARSPVVRSPPARAARLVAVGRREGSVSLCSAASPLASQPPRRR